MGVLGSDVHCDNHSGVFSFRNTKQSVVCLGSCTYAMSFVFYLLVLLEKERRLENANKVGRFA